MKASCRVALLICVFMGGARAALAQTPLGSGTERAAEATAGNQVLQLRYLGGSPIKDIASNLDYGLLLTENREFSASAALMFDTDIVPLSRLHLQMGPQVYLAWLQTGSKTDVFALSVGASARYDLILCNPPYVTDQALSRLPIEYSHEPTLALAGGPDGLDVVRGVLADASAHLNPEGLLVVEVGDGRAAVEREYPQLPLTWATTSAGDGMVFLVRAGDLPAEAATARSAAA